MTASRLSSMAVLVGLAPCVYGNADCAAIEARARNIGVHIPGSESGRIVIGPGQAKFFTAPSRQCKKKIGSVGPGDDVIAYIEQAGFTLVLFINPKTGDQLQGWLESSRLKESGYGIAPAQ